MGEECEEEYAGNGERYRENLDAASSPSYQAHVARSDEDIDGKSQVYLFFSRNCAYVCWRLEGNDENL